MIGPKLVEADGTKVVCIDSKGIRNILRPFGLGNARGVGRRLRLEWTDEQKKKQSSKYSAHRANSLRLISIVASVAIRWFSVDGQLFAFTYQKRIVLRVGCTRGVNWERNAVGDDE